MALKGTLKDFSVADIFQLIGQQQKSGSLHVRAKEREAQVIFDQGKVVLCTFRKYEEDFLLGTMLLRSGVITADQLTQAIATQKTTMRSLGDILIGMHAITVADLSEFIGLQLKEVLFRLLQWKEGLYEFTAEQIRYNKAVIKPQSAESVLMDSFRMLDEWPGVLKKIIAVDSVFRPLIEPIDMTDDVEGYTPEERKVLRLMDGHRSLQEIIYLSRLGTFDTSRAVAGLMDRGLVVRLEQLSQTRIETKFGYTPPETTKSWLKSSYGSLLVLFVLSFMIPVIAFSAKTHISMRRGIYTASGRIFDEAVPLSKMKRENELDHVRTLLRLYRFEKGEYPSSLRDVLSEPMASSWDYQRLEGTYNLK